MQANPLRPVVIAEEDPDDLFLLTRHIRAIDPHLPIVSFPTSQGVIDYLEQSLRLPQHAPLPRVVLTELFLPPADGWALVTWIRRQPALAALDVYLVSGSIDPEHPRRALTLGATGFLPKFPDPHVLAAALGGSAPLPAATATTA